MVGSSTSQVMTMVVSAKNGSIVAVTGSGIRHMSDSLIAFQPAIDEPSNIGALGKDFLVDHADVEGHVLPLAARIGETQIDVFDVVVLDRFKDVFGGLHEYPFWLTGHRESGRGQRPSVMLNTIGASPIQYQMPPKQSECR